MGIPPHKHGALHHSRDTVCPLPLEHRPRQCTLLGHDSLHVTHRYPHPCAILSVASLSYFAHPCNNGPGPTVRSVLMGCSGAIWAGQMIWPRATAPCLLAYTRRTIVVFKRSFGVGLSKTTEAKGARRGKEADVFFFLFLSNLWIRARVLESALSSL